MKPKAAAKSEKNGANDVQIWYLLRQCQCLCLDMKPVCCRCGTHMSQSTTKDDLHLVAKGHYIIHDDVIGFHRCDKLPQSALTPLGHFLARPAMGV